MKVEIYFFNYLYVLTICFNNVKNMITFFKFEKKLGEKKKEYSIEYNSFEKKSSNDNVFHQRKNVALTCQYWLCVN
jgi:hypothetical protein